MKKAARQFYFNILVGCIVILFIFIIAVQAIDNLRNGKWAGGYNYEWQPLGPGIQLAGVAAMLFVLGISAWQYFRDKDNRK